MNTAKINQAYKQAPWRVQAQRGILILLTIVGFMVVAVINLRISAQAYDAGSHIQQAEAQISRFHRQISDLKTELALINASTSMQKRASDLGFVSLNNQEQIVYLVVPGYAGRQINITDVQTANQKLQPSVIKPEYTESLWEYLFAGVLKADKKAQGQP